MIKFLCHVIRNFGAKPNNNNNNNNNKNNNLAQKEQLS